jgi:hypothetical protein
MVREPGRGRLRIAAEVIGALAAAALLALLPSSAQTPPGSALAARGYTALPAPRDVELQPGDFRFGGDWNIVTGPGIAPDDLAAMTLREELITRFQIQFQPRPNAGVVRLSIAPGSVAIGEALDRDKPALAEQAYRLDLSPSEIRIAANAETGLFYGVETLAQLMKRTNSGLQLPVGRIVDWPDLEFRAIYWDDAHHLDQPGYLMHAIRQAAFFKINAFVLKLEGHFVYKSAPAVVEPFALTPAELQQLTDYGLRYHVQLIPYLDGPAHIAFILKHPEYAALREFPQSNYELCATNPDSYKLLTGMYQDLLDANRGVKYFYLSTDEPYYIGTANNAQCQEAARAQQLGSPGKLLAEFLDKTAGFLRDRGRTVLFWGELPLVPGDIPSLPPYLVNGETYGPAFDPAFQARGIREMVYVSTEGEEPMFPDYFILPESEKVHAGRAETPRVEDGMRKIATDTARRQGDVMGAITAAWADAGLHTETFWLGYATIPSAAWNPAANAQEAVNAFFPLYYGDRAGDMRRVYELMSRQAQFYADSWDTVPSKARKPILGNSRGMYDAPRPANDQSIPLPPPPSPKDLSRTSTWTRDNTRRVLLASASLAGNSELLGLLDRGIPAVTPGYPQYNLRIFQTIAQIYRQNLNLIGDLGKIDGLLDSAQENARDGNAEEAVRAVDQALTVAVGIRASRNAVLNDANNIWMALWFPRAVNANNRRFLHELDDIKDHLPDRTEDMSYLIYRELLLPFGEWFDQTQSARNQYAQAHGMDARRVPFDWSNASVR